MSTQKLGLNKKLKDINIFDLSEEFIQDIDHTSKTLNENKIAIIGMFGRAGQADSLDELWSMLEQGKESVRELPEERKKDVEDYLKYRGIDIGSNGVSFFQASYLKNIAHFDYKFFGLSYQEAIFMDPNQRVFLEVAWKALEDAGYCGENIIGTKTGVFVGFSQDFGDDYRRLATHTAYHSPDVAVSGNVKSIIASRIAYFLDLHGPAIMIDTACSSGLVAMYKATQAIVNGECSMALVGSVSCMPLPVIANKDAGIGIVDIQNISASDNHTRTFDDKCDGTYAAEGAFAFLLKSYDEAIRDGDQIRAVILGGAVNQDGASNGLTSPNAEAQKDLIISALRAAQVSAEDISYIEAHGTGTKLGDPIEIDGISKAYRKLTNKKQFCAIGSLKTNIGHLDNAAGLGGVAKIILSMERRLLPASINFYIPNRNINFIEGSVYVNSSLANWPNNDRGVVIAAINSFGISGTNCHLILESPPLSVKKVNTTELMPLFLPISAKTPEALKEIVVAYYKYLRYSDKNLSDIMYTASVGRMHFNARVVFIFKKRDELNILLERFINQDSYLVSEPNIRYGIHRVVDHEQKKRFDYDITYSDLKALEIKALDLLANYNDRFWEDTVHPLIHFYVNGVDIPWVKLFHNTNLQLVSLPTYPFQKSRCWIDYSEMKKNINKRLDHDLLGNKKETIGHVLYTKLLASNDEWELNNHIIYGRCVLPGVAFIQRMITYMRTIWKTESLVFKNISFYTPFTVDNGSEKELHMLIEPVDEILSFKWASLDENNEWVLHGEGEFHRADSVNKKIIDISEIKTRLRYPANLNDEGDAQRGIILKGRWLSLLTNAWSLNNDEEFLVELTLPREFEDDIIEYCFHPSLMDTAVNAANNALQNNTLYLPFYYEKLTVHKQIPRICYSYLKRNYTDQKSSVLSFDITICDLDGICLTEIKNYCIKQFLNTSIPQNMKPYGAIKVFEVYNEPFRYERSLGKILVAGKLRPYTKNLIEYLSGEGYDVNYIPLEKNSWDIVLENLEMNTFEAAIFEWVGTERSVKEFEDWESDEETVIHGFEFIKSWHRFKLKAKKGLILLTDTSTMIDGSENCIYPFQASLVGLWSVAGLEFELSNMRCIEHDQSLSCEDLTKEILSMDRPNYIAYRKGKSYISTIEKTSMEFDHNIENLDPEGVYIITGGTGDIGFEMASLLASKGVKKLILIGKDSIPPKDEWEAKIKNDENPRLTQKLRRLLELENQFYRLEVKNVRIENYDAINALFHTIKNEIGPIKGILHLAGVAGDGYIFNKPLEKFQDVFNVKVKGAINLHLLTLNDSLDFFIHFSSASSLLHLAGQSDYTSANMFLDSFSEYCRKLGKASISIQWPAWRQIGIAHRLGAVDENEIFTPVNPSEALVLFNNILDYRSNVLPVIMPGIYNQSASNFTDTNKLNYAEIFGTDAVNLTLSGVEFVDDIYQSVGEIWHEVLRLHEIDVDDEFNSLGGNSLLISQMLRYYQVKFPEKVNITDLFTYNTVRKQVEYLKKEMEMDERKADIEGNASKIELSKETDEYLNSPEYLEKILQGVISGELSIEESLEVLHI